MWTKPPNEVSCVSSSVESFYRGAVAGGVFGIVFPYEGRAGVLARLGAPLRPALLAGSWCFLTSFASCVLTRGGMGFPFNAAMSGLFSGSAIGLAARWPRETIAWTMVSSAALSVLTHLGMEGQQAHAADKAASADSDVFVSRVGGAALSHMPTEPRSVGAAACFTSSSSGGDGPALGIPQVE
eukprot:TRINITY_DN20949_c0_g1_i1.p2 TRINITY_DN20949_c0_g1~~TRINITY_DN20949_c0_g1_i1.p2  ORF type:complete len:183 (-),score=24.77 TRINITY_DN20949_c0_g1_i1:76-624(-)